MRGRRRRGSGLYGGLSCAPVAPTKCIEFQTVMMAAKEGKLECSLGVLNKQAHMQQSLTRQRHLEDLRGRRRNVGLRMHAQAGGRSAGTVTREARLKATVGNCTV